MQKQVNEFFEAHPENEEVHSALGILFVDKEAAEKILGGVSGHEVVTRKKVLPWTAPVININGEIPADEKLPENTEAVAADVVKAVAPPAAKAAKPVNKTKVNPSKKNK